MAEDFHDFFILTQKDNEQFLASFITIFLLATGLSLITAASIGSADFLPLISL